MAAPALAAWEVRDALEKVMQGEDLAQDGVSKNHVIPMVARAAGWDGEYGQGFGANPRAWAKFHGQVERALDEQAASGGLVKVKANTDRGVPSEQAGWSTSTDPMYYLPAVYEEMSRKANQATWAHQQYLMRQQHLAAQAQAYGLPVEFDKHYTGRSGSMRIPLQVLEVLLEDYAAVHLRPVEPREGYTWVAAHWRKDAEDEPS